MREFARVLFLFLSISDCFLISCEYSLFDLLRLINLSTKDTSHKGSHIFFYLFAILDNSSIIFSFVQNTHHNILFLGSDLSDLSDTIANLQRNQPLALSSRE